jgi:glutathione S-transferase
MLTLYYNRFSLYSRPVWLTLLEKNLSFNLVSLQLNGDQFQEEFLAINPFSRIPVLIDDDLPIVESSAILDYLEAKYPTPALLPTQAEVLAKVRMVQAITINELLPAVVGLIINYKNPSELEYARQRAINVLSFFEDLLQDRPYFAGEQFTIAEIVAGTIIPDLTKLGISLASYSNLARWSKHLVLREAWQTTRPNSEEFAIFQRHLRVLVRIWQKRRRQRTAIFVRRNSQHNA